MRVTNKCCLVQMKLNLLSGCSCMSLSNSIWHKPHPLSSSTQPASVVLFGYVGREPVLPAKQNGLVCHFSACKPFTKISHVIFSGLSQVKVCLLLKKTLWTWRSLPTTTWCQTYHSWPRQLGKAAVQLQAFLEGPIILDPFHSGFHLAMGWRLHWSPWRMTSGGIWIKKGHCCCGFLI